VLVRISIDTITTVTVVGIADSVMVTVWPSDKDVNSYGLYEDIWTPGLIV
jgi:hypothetical protein